MHLRKLSPRLYPQFLAALGLSAAVIVVVLGLGLQIYQTELVLLNQDVETAILVQRLRYRLERQVSTERAFLLTGFPTFRKRLSIDPETIQLIGSLRVRAYTAEEKSLLTEISKQVERYEADLAMTGAGRQSSEAAVVLFENRLRPRRQAISKPLERLLQIENTDLHNAAAGARRHGRQILILGASIAAGLIIILLATAAFVRRSLLTIDSERKSLEAANADLEGLVAERTRHLEQVIQQLEAFGYSVAHDLRAPARTIAIFSELVLKKEVPLDDDARDYFRRIMEAGQRMRLMLDGLLTLSRISQEKLSREPVDLAAVARRRLDELAAQEPERRVEVQVAHSMLVKGDARLLEILMQNLLENAWKFTRDRQDARIEAASETRGGARVYFVRDNGRGFDPTLDQRLFKPFHRLPNAGGVPGLGIGLASSSRIVEAHGGKIWTESRPGEGSTFFFTIPYST